MSKTFEEFLEKIDSAKDSLEEAFEELSKHALLECMRKCIGASDYSQIEQLIADADPDTRQEIFMFAFAIIESAINQGFASADLIKTTWERLRDIEENESDEVAEERDGDEYLIKDYIVKCVPNFTENRMFFMSKKSFSGDKGERVNLQMSIELLQ